MLSQLIKHIQFPKNSEQKLQAQRLFHGRGHCYDDLNHVTVDWLPPVILITLYKPEAIQLIENLAAKLKSLLPECKSVQLQHRYLHQGPLDVISGEEISRLIIQENKLKFQITLGKSRNNGLFLDMKNGRQWVQNNSKNKRVLNLFAYTCGFSVAAIAGGALSVYNIDLSRSALATGRENHRLNQQSLANVKFEKLNIFKSFGRIKKQGLYDLMICDPPTFQKGSVNIAKDYPKIIRRLNEFMAAQSTLLLCLNSLDLDQNFLLEIVREYAPEYQFIKLIKTPEIYHDAEDRGLKILCFKRDSISSNV